MGTRLAVIALMLMSLSVARVAVANPPAFDQAMKDLIDGELERAQQGFQDVAATDTTGWADDGLREAGRVAEMRGRHAEAQQLYRQLVAQHPDSPFVRFANARLSYLARTIGDDAAFSAVQARREALMQEAADLEDPAPALAQYEVMLRGTPDLPTWNEAAMWLGEKWLLHGSIDRGLAWYQEVAARPGPNAGARQRALVAALLQVGRLDAAERALAHLVPSEDVAERAAITKLRQTLAGARAQANWRRLAMAMALSFGFLALAYAMWRKRERGWWQTLAPDMGVMYVMPVGAALVAFSYSRQPVVAAATMWIVAGTVAIMWLLELVLRTRPRAVVAVGFTLFALVAAAAVIYVSVTEDRLIDMLLETWRYGHDPA